MIFVTVGTQHPFPRLIAAINNLAEHMTELVIAQIGSDSAIYARLEVKRSLAPAEYETVFSSARLIVGHAGVGTVLTAKRLCKPLVVLPRCFALVEDVNDHQEGTARQIVGLPGIYVVWDAKNIGDLVRSPMLTPATHAPSKQLSSLVAHLRIAIRNGK